MAVRHLKTEEFDAAVGGTALAMVDFWAPWCGPCRILGPVVESIAEQYDGRVLVAKVNTDEAGELARRFGVENIPTVIFLKEGREFDRRIGALPAEEFTAVLERALSKG